MSVMTPREFVEDTMVSACLSLGRAASDLERAEHMPKDGIQMFAREVAICDAKRAMAQAQLWIVELVIEWQAALEQKP